MNVKFYSNNCPKCKILKNILDEKAIEYEYITDENIYMHIANDKGIEFMPFAEINGEIYNTKKLQNWIVEQKGINN